MLTYDYSDYGTRDLSLIYVRTGGTEGLFKQLLPELQAMSKRPFYLLTSGKSNSLAASMEILSYLRQHDIRGEIIHDSTDYIANCIRVLAAIEQACGRLQGARLGIIGEPSDWLISSNPDQNKKASARVPFFVFLREKLGSFEKNAYLCEIKVYYNPIRHL